MTHVQAQWPPVPSRAAEPAEDLTEEAARAVRAGHDQYERPAGEGRAERYVRIAFDRRTGTRREAERRLRAA